MRIAVIVRSLKIGGMQRAAINLAEAFASQNHETHLIYFKSHENPLSPNESVKTHHFDLNKILKQTIVGLILNLIAKFINIIIRHSYFYLQGLLLTPIFRWKLKKLEKKYGKFDLIIMRGQGTFEAVWPYRDKRVVIQQVQIIHPSKRMFNNFYKRALYSDKNVLCNAPSILDDLKVNFNIFEVIPKKLTLIPSPINTQNIIKKSNEYIPEFKEKYIINIGRLAPTKNILFLIDTFAYAKKNLSLVHNLVIVGDGAQKNDLQKHVKSLNLEKHVHFTGALTNPYPWLKYADLFVFTSKNEGLPNVLLESLACKTDIVSTRGKGGTIDIMSGDLERNLTDFNIEELAKKIIYVLGHPNQIEHDKYLKKYTPAAIVNKYIKEFKLD